MTRITEAELLLRRGRADFELPEEVVWLDTAHQGPIPARAADAARRGIAWKADPSRLPEEEFFAAPDRLRTALAALLDLPASELVIGNSASYGLDLLARGLDLRAGDEILLVADDFPATITPWLPLRRRGVAIQFLPVRRGLDASTVEAALRPRTRLFCTTWVDSFSGHVLDAAGVGAICRGAGVLFVLNATQGFGVRPLDVRAARVDAVTCSGYKWLCGPYGTGFCWLAGEVMDRLQPGRRYWLPSAREHGLHALEDLATRPAPGPPAAHDVFCTASFLNVLPWIAALEYLAELGLERIAAHNVALVRALRTVARAHGLIGPATGSGFGHSPMLVLEGVDGEAPSRVARALRDRRIHVGLRGGRIRVSPHVHNVAADVERFARALAEIAP